MLQKQNNRINTSKNDDLAIIEEILNGNKNLFSVLQKKYSKLIKTLIRKMIKDEDDVEDLVQETFIKAYKSLDRFQSNYTFSSWIYKIASNSCIDFLRKKRLNIVSLDQPFTNKNDDDDNIHYEIEDNSYQPDIEFINNERKNALIDSIENLPEKYKIIIKMRHEEELDYNEIAEKLNLPLGTVKVHLFRARKLLLDNLKKYNIQLD